MTSRSASGAAATIRGTMSSVDSGIGREQPEPAGGVVAVGGATRLFVGTGREHDDRGAAQIIVVARPERNGRREDRSVLQIGDGASSALVVAVHENDLARGSPQRHRKQTRRTDCTRTDDANLHEEPILGPCERPVEPLLPSEQRHRSILVRIG